MNFDYEFWKKYADENDTRQNEEFAKFVKDLAFSLKANNVLEVGCNTGNDLTAFPKNFSVCGVDLNEYALEKARRKLPSFKFKKSSCSSLPFDDSSFDFVFTHKVLNYLDNAELEKSLKEIFRVARKYIVNFELFGEKEEYTSSEKHCRKRNVYKRWLDFKVKIISNVDMHEEIDPEKSRFVLVKKL